MSQNERMMLPANHANRREKILIKEKSFALIRVIRE